MDIDFYPGCDVDEPSNEPSDLDDYDWMQDLTEAEIQSEYERWCDEQIMRAMQMEYADPVAFVPVNIF